MPLVPGIHLLGAMDGTDWLIAIGIAVVAVVVFGVVQSRRAGSAMARAKAEAQELQRKGEDEVRAAAQKAELESKRALIAERERSESEIHGKREELRELERRLAKREDQHERKAESLGQQEAQVTRQSEELRSRQQQVAKREGELEQLIDRQKQELVRVTGMSQEEARQTLLKMVEEDARHDAAHIVRKLTEEAQAEAKDRAREVTLMAVQRFASEHVAESTVRSVPIPSDDMKGRIIGREGRNIRAIEKATGVDIIVDDTPGVIVVSCFDKVRQTIAAEALLKLIQDGRIHPTRVEEVVEQVRKEMDERIIKHGKDSVLEVNLRGVHPKVSEAMGRLHFRTSYGQNVLRHSIEVAFISQIIADQLGLDGTIARRCGFLHDIGKAMDQDQQGTHPKIGHDFAKQYGEKEPVLNAIAGHHGDVPSTSFYTPIVMAADAVSGARPGARRESLEKYIQRLEQLQGIALDYPGVEEAHAIQAGREVRVMVDAKRISDDEAFMVAKKIADRVSAEMTFPGEIRVTVLRETRAVEIAR